MAKPAFQARRCINTIHISKRWGQKKATLQNSLLYFQGHVLQVHNYYTYFGEVRTKKRPHFKIFLNFTKKVLIILSTIAKINISCWQKFFTKSLWGRQPPPPPLASPLITLLVGRYEQQHNQTAWHLITNDKLWLRE